MEDFREHSQSRGRGRPAAAPTTAELWEAELEADTGGDRREMGEPAASAYEELDLYRGPDESADSDAQYADEDAARYRFGDLHDPYNRYGSWGNRTSRWFGPAAYGRGIYPYRTNYFPRSTGSPAGTNFRLGPMDFRVGAGAYSEYNTNIRRTGSQGEFGKLDDWVFGGYLDLNGEWQATRNNRLTLNLGIGIERYLEHQDVMSPNDFDVFVTPNSSLAWDIFVGDAVITLFDRFSVTQTRRDDFALDALDIFGTYTNSLGASVYLPMNSAWDLTFGYSWFVSRAIERDYEFQDRDAHEVFASTSFSPHGTWRAGLEATGSHVAYKENLQNDSTGANFGPFLELPVSHYTTIRLGAGMQWRDFNGAGLNGDSSNLSDPYYNIAINNQLNRYFTHSLTLGHETGLGVVTNATTVDYARYGFTVDTQRYGTISAGGYYEIEDDSGGTFSEDVDRYGFDLYYRHLVARNLYFGAGGHWGRRDSDLAERGYEDWRIDVDLSYALSRKFDLGVGYRYWTTSADDVTQDFDQHRVIFNLNYTF